MNVGRAVFIALLATTSAAGQSANAHVREVDTFITQQIAARHIPGAAVAVVSRGKTILLHTYGLSDVEQSVRVSEHTVFEIASITKQFTATAIMMLVQDQKLRLDDSLAAVLDSLPAQWRPITIRQLLNHTSGIADYAQPRFPFDVRKEYKLHELLNLVANAPLEFIPGTKHTYSNTGYVLLGRVIEQRSGQSYDRFLKRRIFEPLGMKDTRLNDRSMVLARRARGYTLVDYTITNSDYTSPSTTFSAGGLVSSVADMALWLAAQGSSQLLARERWTEMWSKPRLADGATADYGFGWYVRMSGTHRRLEHSGGIQGFATYTAHFPDDSLSIVFIANSDVPLGRLGAGIFEIYLPSLRSSPPKSIASTETVTSRFLQRVATALSQGRGDSAWYTPKVVRFYFPNRIESRKAIGQLGTMRSFELIAIADEGNRQRRNYRALMGATWVRFTFWITSDGLVDGVNFEIE